MTFQFTLTPKYLALAQAYKLIYKFDKNLAKTIADEMDAEMENIRIRNRRKEAFIFRRNIGMKSP